MASALTANNFSNVVFFSVLRIIRVKTAKTAGED